MHIWLSIADISLMNISSQTMRWHLFCISVNIIVVFWKESDAMSEVPVIVRFVVTGHDAAKDLMHNAFKVPSFDSLWFV